MSAWTRSVVLVCDVNETLLDVAALEPHFARVFGDGTVRRQWFSALLLYSNLATLAGPYADFGVLAGAVLDMMAEGRGVRLTPDDREQILSGMRSLPAHPDVRPGLERLRDEGFRLVTLTNSSPAMVEQQLRHAGLADLFERAFSVDEVKRFKPAPEPYRHVAERLGVPTGNLRMIAAHAWDVAGAMRAGLRGAFIARPGQAVFPLGPVPDVIAPDFVSAAEQILARDVG